MKKVRIFNKIFSNLAKHPWIFSLTIALLLSLFVGLITIGVGLSIFLLRSNDTFQIILGVLILLNIFAMLIRVSLLNGYSKY